MPHVHRRIESGMWQPLAFILSQLLNSAIHCRQRGLQGWVRNWMRRRREQREDGHWSHPRRQMYNCNRGKHFLQCQIEEWHLSRRWTNGTLWKVEWFRLMPVILKIYNQRRQPIKTSNWHSCRLALTCFGLWLLHQLFHLWCRSWHPSVPGPSRSSCLDAKVEAVLSFAFKY